MIILLFLDQTFDDFCLAHKILGNNMILKFLFKQNSVDPQPGHFVDLALELMNEGALFFWTILRFAESHDNIMIV